MNKLLVITGPTAVGKTTAAVNLAKKFGGEIVSADSRQVYRGMNIGTAKPTEAQRREVKHHLIDVASPDEPFTLQRYQALAYEAIDQVIARGSRPILVGGTGLYIQAVVDGLKIPHVPPDESLRESLEALSPEKLITMLTTLDPDSAKVIPPQNKRRLIRAIEVTKLTGQPFSVLGRQFHRRYETRQIGLTAPRDELYRRADGRVDRWLKEGWIDEVKTLRKSYPENLPAMTSLGYRQMGMYLDGKISLEEAVKRVKFDIHGYIRRQMTWFRRDQRIDWYDTTPTNWFDDLARAVQAWYADSR